jgi:hypothetical protein
MVYLLHRTCQFSTNVQIACVGAHFLHFGIVAFAWRLCGASALGLGTLELG